MIFKEYGLQFAQLKKVTKKPVAAERHKTNIIFLVITF